MLASILALLGIRRSSTPGPAAIAQARHELTEDEAVTEATIGTPRLEDYSGQFATDLKAVIPVVTEKYANPAPLTFDVDGDDLAQFCAAYGVGVEDIALLEGETVPIRWAQGAPYADWLALCRPDEANEVDT